MNCKNKKQYATDKNRVERVVLPEPLSEFRDALEEEKRQLKKNGQSSTLLTAGRAIPCPGDEHWYRFTVDYLPALPADTPCRLLIGDDQFTATVIGFEGDSIILSTKNPLQGAIGKAKLESDSTMLLDRLISCLEENATQDNPVGKHMLQVDGSVYPAKRVKTCPPLVLSAEISAVQKKAIEAALTYDITYIWGPPGTGKTRVIGHIISALCKEGRSALVVSHTNTAVDGAIAKADEIYGQEYRGDDGDYPLLRIGAQEKWEKSRVSMSAHVKALGQTFEQQKVETLQRQDAARKRADEIQTLFIKESWLLDSRLVEACSAQQAVTRYDADLQEQKKAIASLRAEVQKTVSEHSECRQYREWESSWQDECRKYNDLCKTADELHAAVRELPSRIQQSLDEAQKHDRYAQLCAEEKNYMSFSFLQGEIEKTHARSRELAAEVQELQKKREEARQTIQAFEQKGAVARLFSGRGAALKAREFLRTAETRLPDAEEALQRAQKLLQRYQKERGDLLLIQDEKRSVQPTQTQGYWLARGRDLQTELEEKKENLRALLTQKDVMQKELEARRQQMDKAKEVFDDFCQLEGRLRQTEAKRRSIARARLQARRKADDLITEERERCAAFGYTPIAQELDELCNELSGLQETVRGEIQATDMEALRREFEDNQAEQKELARRLNELQQLLVGLEQQVIMRAKVIGATLTKTYLSKTLRARDFDTVILDEASMASIPALWCASLLAKTSLVIVGDFLQLPPIVTAETPLAQKWLGTDVFYHSGMQQRALHPETVPPNFIMLNDQFRMESDIADLANLYYGRYGGLRSHDDKRCELRKNFYSWYTRDARSDIHMVDTKNLHAWATSVPQRKYPSRMNCFSAAVDVDLAFLLTDKLLQEAGEKLQPFSNPKVLIVTPYKAQCLRLRQLIALKYRAKGLPGNLNLVQAGTVHSFQGSEAPIVIFDLVVDEPHWKANLFIPDKKINAGLRRAFNVAVTRAQFKLYVVGNFTFFRSCAHNNALTELLDRMEQLQAIKEDAVNILPEITFDRPTAFPVGSQPTGPYIACKEDTFSDYFLADIRASQKRLLIYSPFITQARLSVWLPAFTDAVARGVQFVIVTKAPSERKKGQGLSYTRCEDELRAIGACVLYKANMHEKLAFVDDDITWEGSLNILSYTGQTGEIMYRHEDRAFMLDQEKIFEVERICGTAARSNEQRCPLCGGQMILREGAKGGEYWQCVNKDYSRNLSQQYPEDGILRCDCGAPYVFAMRNEPRWVCSKNPRHYRKMRQEDLKLEKMAALIPTRQAREEVDRYFAQKNAKKKKQKQKGGAVNREPAAAISDDFDGAAVQLSMY